jgi:hypothetical protein
MSQIAKQSTGGGGGGDVNSLTPDVGAVVTAVGGTIPTLGYQAATVQTMRTYNDGAGNFRIADQTWETQYVVDVSTTDGLRGTFTTIQAAIAAAVADGAALGNYKKIYIRTGTYTEDLTIPSGVILVGQTFSMPTGGIITPIESTVILGNHTFTGNVVCGFQNLNFVATSGDMFSGGSIVLCYMDNCYFAQTGTDNIFNIVASSSYLSFLDCTLDGSGQTLITMSSSMMMMRNCQFPTTGVINLTDANDATFINCSNIGEISTTGGTINVYSCTFSTNTSTYNISGTASGIIQNCVFLGTSIGVQNTITAKLSNCSSTLGNLIYETGIVYLNPIVMQGSVIHGINITLSSSGVSDYTVLNSDHFLGVNNTISPNATITLPDATLVVNEGQEFIIKDISGNASTNNIIIVVNNSGTIDGSASFTINIDYGSVTVRYDGSNYFII